MRVLLVEDDAMIGGAVQGALKEASYAVDWVQTGNDAVTAANCHQYDVILLDLGLPALDGQDVLRHIRAQGDLVPLLIITARDGLNERLQGLDNGADDYLIKPFDMPELLARMRAVVRRHSADGTCFLTNGIVTLDPVTHEASRHDDMPTVLSNREFALLHALLLRPGAILSRSELEERVYGWGEEVESNAIEYLIHSLRRKLGSDAIKNVRGAGWLVSKRA